MSAANMGDNYLFPVLVADYLHGSGAGSGFGGADVKHAVINPLVLQVYIKNLNSLRKSYIFLSQNQGCPSRESNPFSNCFAGPGSLKKDINIYLTIAERPWRAGKVEGYFSCQDNALRVSHN
jgi:hypothetical protein